MESRTQEVIEKAVQQNGAALKWTSTNCRGNKNLVVQALKNKGWLINDFRVRPVIRNDPQVLEAALQTYKIEPISDLNQDAIKIQLEALQNAFYNANDQRLFVYLMYLD